MRDKYTSALREMFKYSSSLWPSLTPNQIQWIITLDNCWCPCLFLFICLLLKAKNRWMTLIAGRLCWSTSSAWRRQNQRCSNFFKQEPSMFVVVVQLWSQKKVGGWNNKLLVIIYDYNIIDMIQGGWLASTRGGFPALLRQRSDPQQVSIFSAILR